MAPDNEVKKFSDLAADWWDADGPLKTLHDINPTRVDYIESHRDLSNAKVLDLGCGGGILSESLAAKALHVCGLDLSADALNVAEQHRIKNSIHNLNYLCESAEEHAEEHNRFYDVIVCMEMLEHVDDPEIIIHACKKMLKPGGDIFLSTIHRNLQAYLKVVLAAEYLFKWIPPGTHDYQKFIKPSELSQMCRKSELQVKSIIGLGYEPLSRTSFLTSKTEMNYLLHANNSE